MRTRLLALAFAAILAAARGDRPSVRGSGERGERSACATTDRGEATAGASEARREEAEREAEREGGKDAAEIAREQAYADCGLTESQVEERALTEPAEALAAKQLTGADPGIDPGRFWAQAAAQASALGEQTETLDPPAATAAWSLDKPTSIGGRILDVVVDPNTPDTIFAAAATGGVWKSTDKGQNFSLGVAGGPDPDDRGPGDRARRHALRRHRRGRPRRRLDHLRRHRPLQVHRRRRQLAVQRPGRTPTGSGASSSTRRTRSGSSSPAPARSTTPAAGAACTCRPTAGGSWEKVLAGDNATTGAADVAIDPNDSKIVYAALWDNFREKDRRSYEGVGSGLYRSADGGRTWARVGTPFFGPRPDLGRIGVAVAPDGTVYANASGASGVYNGFYASKDGGTTWTTGAPPTVPLDSFYVYGWWFGRIYVDPKDSKHVYQTGVQLQESKNGGQTFANAPGSYHADQHGMAWDPAVAGRVYLGNDGGVYRSDNNGVAWNKFKYLPISQINGFDVSQQDPTRMVVGLQDNGGNKNWTGTKAGNDTWVDYTGGDGQRVTIAPDRQNVIYGCYQYGECVVSTNGGSNTTSFTEQVVSTRKNWFTPIEFDPQDSHTVYTGGEIMSVSTDDGADWTPISPDLTNGPGRETNPLFRNYGTISTIAPAGGSTKTVYAGTDDGNLWFTHDVSDISAWTKATDPDLPKAWITRVAVDPRDPTGDTAYVTYSGFRQDDNAPYILRTTDGGRNWSDITANLPTAPVNDVKVVHGAIVVATDVGVFFRPDGDGGWLRLGSGLPIAPAYELRLQKASDTLYVGTFGRSAWKIDAGALG